MMKRHYPAIDILVCDRCGVEGEKLALGDKDPFRNGANYSIECWGRDCLNVPAGVTYNIDLCGKCYKEFLKWKSKKD